MDLLIPPAQQAALASMTDPLNFPTEYLGWLDDRIKQLAIQQVPKSSVGDYKVSAQTADHTDSAGGTWLICDGTAVDASLTALTALIGATRPDARGRALVMKGTHADVSTILNSDGLAVGTRTPQHNTTKGTLAVTPNPHLHTTVASSVNTTVDVGAAGAVPQFNTTNTSSTTLTMAGAGGPGGTRPDDAPAYLVAGNLFIHT